jgi:hypothetical protein
MFVIAGMLYLLAVSIILIYPRIRQVELELPDAIPMNRKSSVGN